MGPVKFTRLATTISWPLLRDKRCQEALYNGLSMDKIDELVILSTRQSPKKPKDKTKKMEIMADLPDWMTRHMVYPIGMERHYQTYFIRRMLTALDIDIFIAGNKQEAEYARSWTNYKNAPLNGLQIHEINSLADYDRMTYRMQYANRFEPFKSALEKVR